MLLPWQLVTFQKKIPIKSYPRNQKESLKCCCYGEILFFLCPKAYCKSTITLHGNKIFDFPLNFLRQLLMENFMIYNGNSATTPF